MPPIVIRSRITSNPPASPGFGLAAFGEAPFGS